MIVPVFPEEESEEEEDVAIGENAFGDEDGGEDGSPPSTPGAAHPKSRKKKPVKKMNTARINVSFDSHQRMYFSSVITCPLCWR